MGLLDVFGDKINPGLLNGIRSLGALSGFDEGNVVPLRIGMEQQAQLEKDRELETQRQNQTSAYLRKMGQEELANAVDLGLVDGKTAFSQYYQQVNAKPELTANQRDFQFAQQNPGFMDFIRPPETSKMPTSYQEYQLAQQDPKYAASLNSTTSRPPTEGQRRNQQLSTVTTPELAAVEANWADLTDPKNQAIGANTPLGAPGFALTSPGYQQATSALKTIAQSYLYSVSGAAATNEETQKIVDAVTPKFGESKESADAKLDRIRTMVESIKTAGGAAPAGDVVSDNDPFGIR